MYYMQSSYVIEIGKYALTWKSRLYVGVKTNIYLQLCKPRLLGHKWLEIIETPILKYFYFYLYFFFFLQEDLSSLAKNKSFVFSTLAFTCVTFVTGALSWWGPKFIEDGLQTMKEDDRGVEISQVSFIFGVVMMMSGIVGVPLGMTLSTQLKSKYPRADPVICAGGLLASSLFLCVGLVFVTTNIYMCFLFIFLGSVALNLNWSIIADMLLYIVTPTCRSTAEAIQILASHAFGDAGSPYLIGLVS